MAENKKDKGSKDGSIPVIAVAPCTYGGIYRKEGARFSVDSEREISSAMAKIGSEKHVKAEEVAKEKEKTQKEPETIKEAGKVVVI